MPLAVVGGSRPGAGMPLAELHAKVVGGPVYESTDSVTQLAKVRPVHVTLSINSLC
jgi:hypothetical protein